MSPCLFFHRDMDHLKSDSCTEPGGPPTEENRLVDEHGRGVIVSIQIRLSLFHYSFFSFSFSATAEKDLMKCDE